MLKNSSPQYFYTQDGTRIFYNTNFSKGEHNHSLPVLIFNYGLVCNHQHWQEQIPFFEEQGYSILLHDYRCHYSSSGELDLQNCHFIQMANDLNELVESLELEHLVLLGHSMGVNISLEYASIFPSKVRGLILISGTVLPPQDIMFDSNMTDVLFPYIMHFSKTYPEIFQKIWKTSYMNPIIRTMVYRGGFNTTKVSEEFVQVYMKKISELPQDILLHLLLEMKNHNIINRLESVQAKTLVMGGDKDKVIPYYLQVLLHQKIPNSQLYNIKEGSHVPQVDFPESVNERIHTFLKEV
jgi:pimeloyl-ACP methyl ester carboxylesterase